ncbi:COG4223 family protein [Stappia sp. TSB10GB4]|uniref:COG4223 family protein n=1 Tax=Stappia sp. TSB10GB4 TaxID=2003584 RepID=UPI0016479DC5|nr:mitofilin family membrane protein [Stappia sp. TSB10GB4]
MALGGVWGANQAGLLSSGAISTEFQSALTAAQSRISGLETQLAGLAERETPSAAVEAGLKAAESRISDLEAALRDTGAAPDAATGALPEEATARIAEIETGLAELRRFVSSGGAGESAGLASLQEAQDTLDAALKQVSDDQQALTARLGELAAKLPDTSDLSGGLAELRDRATTLGQDLEDLKGSLTGLRQELDTLSNGQTSLAARVEEGVASLTARLTALDDRLSPVEARMGDVSARETAARAVAVSSLRAAMDRGEPYATELAAVASALPEGTDLSALTARADRGVPTRSVLKANFPAVARTMAAEIDAPADGDLVGGLLANARALVSIRQPGESDAATPQAALGRMEARVDSGDLAGALTAYEELPQTVRAAGADWVADARARLAVDALMDRVTGDVLKSMGGSAAPAASN